MPILLLLLLLRRAMSTQASTLRWVNASQRSSEDGDIIEMNVKSLVRHVFLFDQNFLPPKYYCVIQPGWKANWLQLCGRSP